MPLSRMFAIALISASLALLGISHFRYGLAAQSGLLLSILPLLFAGLLLGRHGLWITAGAYLIVLVLGSWTDLQQGTAVPTLHDAIANLLQPVMGCAIVGLILDRLILKSDINRQRTHELVQLCRQLEVEIREKEQSQAQLTHSQRMDSLGKLAGNAAHDFNNVLSVILGYASQRDTPFSSEAANEQLDRIVAATRRGKQMTDKLLTLARIDPPLRETFDANASLRDLLPMIRSMLGRRVEVVTELGGERAWVHMDYMEFEAGVLNIVKNAADAMPEGGGFRIASERVGEEVHLRFEDTGHGMPADVAERVFEPFFTTKPPSKGSGIGLAMVYRTIAESGGRVEVRSDPGHGTGFLLRLPLREFPQYDDTRL